MQESESWADNGEGEGKPEAVITDQSQAQRLVGFMHTKSQLQAIPWLMHIKTSIRTACQISPLHPPSYLTGMDVLIFRAVASAPVAICH